MVTVIFLAVEDAKGKAAYLHVLDFSSYTISGVVRVSGGPISAAEAHQSPPFLQWDLKIG